MRKKATLLSVCLAVLTLSNAGCIFIVGVKDLPCQGYVVEIDGEHYIVDKEHHRLREIDMESLSEVEVTTGTQAEDATD